MIDKLLEYDRDLLLYLNGLGADTYDSFWITITNSVSWTPLFLLFLILVLKSYPKKEAWLVTGFVLGALAFNLIFTEIIKESVMRIRPNNDPSINTLLRILIEPSSYSFFSGHASSSFTVTVILILFIRKHFKWSYLFFLWPLLFSFSRIYAGVHYPSDILTGALAGTLIGITFYKLFQRLKPRRNL
ncbi:phosphatase PAP2 family protein [Leptobacterium flavescens]|uniref:Phosphatase PAP2 family protein n=1 Tax=Leptobacterium flavescens TaxID=472055 RepID=A0A6P0UPU2_9FLAO|nr:phosphatase PAP2 family protein [Leptobacterium flavescens]NER12396.1 phosphatase PAP2 family protein [Leptobacterium flavescens]